MVKVCKHMTATYDNGDALWTDWSFEYTDNNGKTAWQLGHPTHDPLGEYEAAARLLFGNDVVDKAIECYTEPEQEEGLMSGGGGEES